MGVTTETGKGRVESEELVTDVRAHRQNRSQKKTRGGPSCGGCVYNREEATKQSSKGPPAPSPPINTSSVDPFTPVHLINTLLVRFSISRLSLSVPVQPAPHLATRHLSSQPNTLLIQTSIPPINQSLNHSRGTASLASGLVMV